MCVRKQDMNRRTRMIVQAFFRRGPWRKSFNPYCWSSYSENATARIRLPCFSYADEQLPMLSGSGDDFVLRSRIPNVQCELHVRVHEHIRDMRITFTQATHSYHVNGCAPQKSDALVHCLTQDFNADDSVSEMMASSRRPRPEYARDVNGLLYPRHLDAPSD